MVDWAQSTNHQRYTDQSVAWSIHSACCANNWLLISVDSAVLSVKINWHKQFMFKNSELHIKKLWTLKNNHVSFAFMTDNCRHNRPCFCSSRSYKYGKYHYLVKSTKHANKLPYLQNVVTVLEIECKLHKQTSNTPISLKQ